MVLLFARNMVDSFNTLYTRFLARFIDCNPIVAISTSLHNVVHRKGEGLRQYMTRFSRAMHALLVGLCRGKLLDTLYSEPSKDMDQLRVRATIYTSIKENANTSTKGYKGATLNDFLTFIRGKDKESSKITLSSIRKEK